MKVLGIIPARYKSSRLPGKPLAQILGKPLIQYVCEIVEQALGKENFVVATDDQRIEDAVNALGYRSVMTSSDHLTGTDRLAEVATKIDADIYINIQGDEPLLDPKDILKTVEEKEKHFGSIINCMTKLRADEDPASLTIPKVVTDRNNKLLYMSRAAIPGNKTGELHSYYYKQVCIYAFNNEELELFRKHPSKTELESYEDIEILRFLELGKEIKMIEVESSSLAVDVPDDIIKVEKELNARRI